MDGDVDNTKMRLLLAGILLVLAIGAIVSLILDGPGSWRAPHTAFDVLMDGAALAAVTYVWWGWRRAVREAERLRVSLEERRAERDAWRTSAQKTLDGLGEAIDRQFESWALTPAEREVALLVLKGHSHKRIARVTGRSEHTVRQHAGSAYQKAGLHGRAELAAFFLEDLMLPATTPDARPKPAPRNTATLFEPR
ncbi:MAG: LuxR C-terminal-related transcriptional regulator [Gemmatimonadota bacterium]